MAKDKDQQVEAEEEAPDDLTGDTLIADAKKAGMNAAEIEAIKKAQSEMGEEDEDIEAVAKGGEDEEEEEEEAPAKKKDAKAEESEEEEEPAEKDEEEETETADGKDKKDDDGEDEEEQEEEPEGKKTESAKDEDEDDESAPLLALLPVERFDTAKVEARYAEIKKAKIELNAKLVSGDITSEEHADKMEKLDDERTAIKDRIARSAHNAEVNQQMQQTLFAQSRASFIRRATDLNYKDKATVKHFDRAVNILLEDPEFAKAGFDALDDLFDEAHKMTLARVGKPAAPKKAAATETEAEPTKKPADKTTDGKGNKVVKLVPKPKTEEPRSTVKNLAALPTAHKGDEGQDDVIASLKGLEGEELELAMAKLPAKELDRVLRKLST